MPKKFKAIRSKGDIRNCKITDNSLNNSELLEVNGNIESSEIIRNKIEVNQKAHNKKDTVGISIRSESPQNLGMWLFLLSIAVIAGLIVFFASDFYKKYFGENDMKNKVNKIDDISVKQKGTMLENVKGVEIKTNKTDVEIGKIDVLQEAGNMINVKGVEMNFDEQSGEISLKDKWQIDQNSSNVKTKIVINADQPGTKVIFNKKNKNGVR